MKLSATRYIQVGILAVSSALFLAAPCSAQNAGTGNRVNTTTGRTNAAAGNNGTGNGAVNGPAGNTGEANRVAPNGDNATAGGVGTNATAGNGSPYTNNANNPNTNHNSGGGYGAWGLVGLIGLFGLFRGGPRRTV